MSDRGDESTEDKETHPEASPTHEGNQHENDDERDGERVDPSDPPASWAMRTSDDGPDPHDARKFDKALKEALCIDEDESKLRHAGQLPEPPRMGELSTDDIRREQEGKSRAQRAYDRLGQDLVSLDRGDLVRFEGEHGTFHGEITDIERSFDLLENALTVRVGYVIDAVDDRQTLRYRSNELWKAEVSGYEREAGNLVRRHYGRLKAVERIDGDDGPAVRA